MDQRIQELQQRIKKRRSQQQVQQQQQQNKNILNQNKYCGRPQGTNVAAVEPYVQQVIKDTAHDDLCKNTGFMKKDPKYQSLPSNTKFTPDKNSIGEPSRELNNNEQTEDKQLPSGVHSDFYRRKLESNGPKSGQSSNGSLSVERLDGLIPTGDQSVGPGKENKVCSASNQGAPKFNVTNIAKYAPRPFGSTYSTTVLAGRLPGQSLQQPVINITEEERQAGSGQSSPASSDSSHNSPSTRGTAGVPNGGQLVSSAAGKQQKPTPPVRNSSNQPTGQPAPSEKGSSVPRKGPSKSDNSQNIPNTQPKSGQPVSASFVFSKKGVQTLVSESKIPSANVTYFSSKDSPQNGTDSHQGDFADGKFSYESPTAEKPQPYAHSAPVTSSNSGGSATASQAGGPKGIPTYRYATKNAIMNTYMGKLGSSALQKYQANMQKLYQNANLQTADPSKRGESSSPENTSSPKETSGSYNVPKENSGSYNVPKENSGSYNVPKENSGSYNVPKENSGSYNVPKENSGSYNVPKENSGSYNIPKENSGSYNVPKENSGIYNVPTASHTTANKDKEKAGFEQRTAFNQPVVVEGDVEGSDSPTRTHTHFGLVGLPQYQHIASDKGSYKANTPKQVRRRHSDSDNEDLHKYLRGGYDKYSANQKISSGLSTYQSSVFSNNEQTESGGSGSSAQSDSNQSDSNQSDNNQSDSNCVTESSSTQASPLPSSDGVVLRKKTNLKTQKSKRVSNRVSFDPLALLLDASLEGELDLVVKTAKEVTLFSLPFLYFPHKLFVLHINNDHVSKACMHTRKCIRTSINACT